ncbi:uncharacterized protein LOC123444257 [Hordeum vulgare subsp. vulgare]|uniref:Predicted protein n=1 Tax=Hordeum vulgare subsp. vulgare TaxID=112509 RepID=F2CYG8_HORVV|nr:uncharacterized protein LOC123444257 [Hordeum vulgare subsp. vulgare]BAJ87889.1 predicted protein [Hordeum vulgare subsp. vulgare]
MASLLFRLVRASLNLSKQIQYPARKPRRNLPTVLGGDFIKRPALKLNCPRYIISTICEFAVSIGLLWTLWCYFTYDSPRVFSARLTPAIPRNGSVGAPAAMASTRHRAALDVVLHASNRRATGSCYHHGEGAVTYGGYTVASGRAPDFCVPWNGAREVPFRLAWDWDDGSGLPESLRGRIAAAEKVGAVEFEVQVRLLRGGDARSGTGTPTWMWCKARMGGAVTPCTVFAPQNWFSPLA